MKQVHKYFEWLFYSRHKVMSPRWLSIGRTTAHAEHGYSFEHLSSRRKNKRAIRYSWGKANRSAELMAFTEAKVFVCTSHRWAYYQIMIYERTTKKELETSEKMLDWIDLSKKVWKQDCIHVDHIQLNVSLPFKIKNTNIMLVFNVSVQP